MLDDAGPGWLLLTARGGSLLDSTGRAPHSRRSCGGGTFPDSVALRIHTVSRQSFRMNARSENLVIQCGFMAIETFPPLLANWAFGLPRQLRIIQLKDRFFYYLRLFLEASKKSLQHPRLCRRCKSLSSPSTHSFAPRFPSNSATQALSLTPARQSPVCGISYLLAASTVTKPGPAIIDNKKFEQNTDPHPSTPADSQHFRNLHHPGGRTLSPAQGTLDVPCWPAIPHPVLSDTLWIPPAPPVFRANFSCERRRPSP